MGGNQNGAKNICKNCGQDKVAICIHYLNGSKGIGSKCNCGIFNKNGGKVNAKMKKDKG